LRASGSASNFGRSLMDVNAFILWNLLGHPRQVGSLNSSWWFVAVQCH
jgi:hypothetical protein